VVIGKTPYCFDPSLREIFVPLLVGAKLVLMPQDTHKDMNKLINYISRYNVNMALFVPSQMQVFLQLLRDEYLDLINTINLKVIYSVGEKLTVSLAKNILEMFPNVKLYNCQAPILCTL
jgi:non-ribosomal peptide synthetase component F